MAERHDFRLLGPLEIRHRGQALELGIRRQRLVLGLLLLEAGRPVSLHRLAELAWYGERQPRTARNAIQVCVSHLRTRLGTGAPIVHSGGRYRIDIDPMSVDAHRFRSLVAQARARDVRDERRVELLAGARDLWRGAVLEGTFTDELRRQVCGRLDEERAIAVECWAEALLRLGRTNDVVVELAGTTSEFPARERLVYLTMLALYRDGQASRALEVYREFRASLAEQVGIDPGPELRGLEVAILRRAEHLTGSPAPAPATAAPVNQLPPAIPHFVGRAVQLRTIAGHLTAQRSTGPALVAVTGMGGIGKTSLAVRAARDCLAGYPDGCLFVDLRGTDEVPATPHAALGVLLRSLGVAPSDVPDNPDERVGKYRSIAAPQRLLVVLDNAGSAAQARPLIPSGNHCAALITSRHQLSALDVLAVTLGPLRDEESLALLQLVAGGDPPTGGIVTPDQLAGDPAAARQLVRLSGGVPLAVRVLAARLASGTVSPGRLAAQLASAVSRLDEFVAGDLEVGASLMLSYRRLEPDSAVLFRRLGLSRLVDVTDWTCGVLIDGAERGARALRELAEVHLAHPLRLPPDSCQQSGPVRFGLHDLVQLAARAVALREEPAGPAVVRRLVEAYLHTANSAVVAMHFGRAPRYVTLSFTSPYHQAFADHATAARWLADECGNLRVVTTSAADAGLPEYAWQLAHVVARYLAKVHRVDEMRAFHELGARAARALDTPHAIASMLVIGGFADHIQARYQAALQAYQRALRHARNAGDELLAAYITTYVGRMLQATGRPGAAERHFRRALAVPAYAADLQEVAYTRLDLAAVYAMQGQHEAASAEFERVLTAVAEFDDWNLACFAHHNIGALWLLRGSLEQALAHTRTAIEIATRIGFGSREARGWEQLGEILHRSGDHAAAVDAWRNSAARYESIGDARAQRLLRQLGAISEE